MTDEFKPQPRRTLRVLVVDDMVGSAKIMAKLLEKFWGHEVRIAHEGETALEIAAEFRPELVLLDIGLPGMSGHETARRLRELSELDETLLVALTGYGDNEDRERSQAAGFDEHLVKPASVDQIQQLFDHPKLLQRN